VTCFLQLLFPQTWHQATALPSNSTTSLIATYSSFLNSASSMHAQARRVLSFVSMNLMPTSHELKLDKASTQLLWMMLSYGITWSFHKDLSLNSSCDSSAVLRVLSLRMNWNNWMIFILTDTYNVSVIVELGRKWKFLHFFHTIQSVEACLINGCVIEHSGLVIFLWSFSNCFTLYFYITSPI